MIAHLKENNLGKEYLLASCIHGEALYLENASEIGPHVLTVLKTEEPLIGVENILPEGFNCRGHLDDPSRTRWEIESWLPIFTVPLETNYFQRVN